MARILDLFSGAGGAAMGYHQAGFTEIVGVDHVPQPRYPFTFIQADALEYVAAHGQEFDVIHASPPCQAYSCCTPLAYRAHHPRLIASVQQLLDNAKKPYVIENVAGARRFLRQPFFLCGSMFRLPIWRHRYFETNGFPFPLVWACNHSILPVLVSGTFRRKGQKRRDYTLTQRAAAMQIDWMQGKELDQAIPPAYTEWIGTQLLARIS